VDVGVDEQLGLLVPWISSLSLRDPVGTAAPLPVASVLGNANGIQRSCREIGVMGSRGGVGRRCRPWASI
jgi:hypothetical protein